MDALQNTQHSLATARLTGSRNMPLGHWQPTTHIMLHIIGICLPQTSGHAVPHVVCFMPAAVCAELHVGPHAPFGAPTQRTFLHCGPPLHAQNILLLLL